MMIENLSDLKGHGIKSSLRSFARKNALDFLSVTNRWIEKDEIKTAPRLQFIYIHHVFNDEVESFRSQIAHLAKTYTFLSYSEAINRIKTGQIDRPYMAFSSDDGFLNNKNAAKVLESFGATACFFLNTNTIGLTDPKEIERFCRERLHLPAIEFLTWGQVNQLQAQGHEVGSHTSDHYDVSRMDHDAFVDDLSKTKQIIEEHAGPIQHFAFPYGRWSNFSKKALNATIEVGFQSVATAERGCHLLNGPEHSMIYRDHVLAKWPARHLDYFFSTNVRNALKRTEQPY